MAPIESVMFSLCRSVLPVRGTTPQTVKRGDETAYQTGVQKQVEEKLVLDVVVGVTESGDEESRRTARREENSQFHPSPRGACLTVTQDEY